MRRLWIVAALLLALANVQCKSSDGGGGDKAPGAGDAGRTSMSAVDATAPDPAEDAAPAPPPTFAGVTSATTVDENQVALTWSPATGGGAPQGSMVYRVYAGTASGAEDFTSPVATTPAGATGAVVGGLHAATTYYFVVRALNTEGTPDANTTEKSATTTDTTAPVFAGVQSLTGTDRDKLLVTWNAAKDNAIAPISYRIFSSTTQGGEDFTTPSATSPAGATQFTLTGLTEATSYFVVVRAVDAAGNSDRNDKELEGATLDKTPPVFAGASSAQALGTTVTVAWSQAVDAVDPIGAATYDVYMATTAGAEDFKTPTFTTASGASGYTDVHLAISTTYYFVVRAKDSSGNEDDNTHEVSATTAASPDVTPPTFGGLLAATGTSDTTTDLSWAAASDDYSAAKDIVYDIYMASSPGGETFTTPSFTSDPGATSFTVVDLQPLETAYFVVRARDQAGNEGADGDEQTATTLADTVPPSFQGLTAAAPSSPTTIDLSWAPASDDVTAYTAITYRVYAGPAPGAEGTLPLATTVAAATSFRATGLTPNTSYTFYVRAVDAAGNPDTSTPPVEISAATPPDVTPPTFGGVASLVSTDPQTITAGWSAADDYVTPPASIVYWAYLATGSGAELSTTPVTTAPGATSVTFTGLTPMTTYYVIVRAVDAAGNVDGNTTELSAATQADVTPPQFAGAGSVGSATDSSLKVTWLAAIDAVTGPSAIQYLVCMTTSDGGCNGSSFTTTATITGGLTYTVGSLIPNTTYYFVVRAVDQAGNDDGNSTQVSGLTAKDQTAPTFPVAGTGLTATALADASIRLSWSAASDDVSASSQIVYDIYQALAPNGEVYTTPTYTTAAGATSYVIAQQYPPLLQPSQNYSFVVRARDLAGNEDGNKDEASATTLPDKTAPTFAGASNISPATSLTQLTVNWNAASDDITAPANIVYQVCWALDDSCATTFTIDATTAGGATTYTMTGLSAATTYHVLVRARDAAGNSSSNTGTLLQSTLADTTPPSFNGATGCSAATATSLTVNWALASDLYSPQSTLRYLVCITNASNGCGGAGGAFAASATVTNVTSYPFSSLSPTTTYYFVVRAEDQAGNIDGNYIVVSGQTVVDTTAPTFAGLTNVAAAAGVLGDANMTLTWPAASDNVSLPSQIAYDVYQSTSSGTETTSGSPTYSAPAGTLSITVPQTTPGLLPNKTYYYIVRARDAAGNRSAAPYTEKSAMTTADHVAPKFSAGITGLTAFSDSQLMATWSTPATDDTTPASQIVYDVCWNVHGSATPCTTSFTVMDTTAAGATSYTNVVRALAPSTLYDVVVRAQDASGNIDTNTVSLTAKTSADASPPTFGGATSVSGATLTSLTVNWAAASDDVTLAANMVYDICETTSNGGCTAFSKTVTGVSGTSYQFTGLVDHQTYYFVVRARDQAGNEDTGTTQVSGMTLADSTAPAFTAGLSTVGSATPTTLALTWGLATDNYSSQTNITFSVYEATLSGHEVYTSPTVSGLAQTSGSTNTYTVTGLSPATNYCFVVRASDQAGNQDGNTHEVCTSTLQVPAPTFTTQPVATPSYASFSLSWAATVSPTSTIDYSVCYSTSSVACPSSGTTVAPSPPTSTSISITGLTPTKPGTAYYFLVRATDAGGTTSSTQVTATTLSDTIAPSPPTGLSVTASSSYPGGVTFNWADSTDTGSTQANLGYVLCVGTGCSPSYTLPAGAGNGTLTTAYLGTGINGTHGSALTSNTAYSFYIEAIDQAGNVSGQTGPANVTTDVSYSHDIDALIFNGGSAPCNGCHSTGGGTYEPGPFNYAYIVNKTVPSGGVCTSGTFVVPGSPTTSVIWERMDAVHVAACNPTDQMPYMGPYSTTNINAMHDWIVQGAVNN